VIAMRARGVYMGMSAAMALVAACLENRVQGQGPGGATTYASTPEGLCQVVLDVSCAGAVACGAAASQASCSIEALAEACRASFPSASGALQVSVDSAKVSICIATLDTCGEDLPEACEQTFQGKVADGGACVNSVECKTPRSRCPLDADCNGACTPPGAEGEKCLGPCQPGYWCVGSVCQKAAQKGEACGTVACDENLYCVDGKCAEYASAAAKCPAAQPGEHCLVGGMSCIGDGCALSIALWVEQGQSCAPYQNTDPTVSISRRCQQGLTCGVSQICGPPLPAGGTCEPDAITYPPQCAEGLYCDSSAKKCAPESQSGGPCVAATLPSGCEQDLWCNQGTCAAFPGNGQDCSMSYSCAEGYRCGTDQKCAPNGAIGDTCAFYDECASSRCFEGKCAKACN
jgi:hypothetical protein